MNNSPFPPPSPPSDSNGATAFADERALTVIEPPRGWQWLNAGELWQRRELLYFLIWRDVKVRYKQTVLGAAWALLQPLTLMLIFSLVLGRITPAESLPVAYPLFVFSGLIGWYLFSTGMGSAATSLIESERLITKIYFPRLLVPLGAIGPSVLDFSINVGCLLAMMAWYRTPPAATCVALPLPIAVMLASSVGAGSLLAALNVRYRDFRYTTSFLIQAWMFATPAIYLGPAAVGGTAENAGLERRFVQLIEWLNPLQGSILFFRAAWFGGALPWASLAVSAVAAALLLLAGLAVFRRVEDSFADII